jgi:hypothetical protein
MMLYFTINRKRIISKVCHKIFFGDNKKINCLFSLQLSESKIFFKSIYQRYWSSFFGYRFFYDLFCFCCLFLFNYYFFFNIWVFIYILYPYFYWILLYPLMRKHGFVDCFPIKRPCFNSYLFTS